MTGHFTLFQPQGNVGREPSQRAFRYLVALGYDIRLSATVVGVMDVFRESPIAPESPSGFSGLPSESDRPSRGRPNQLRSVPMSEEPRKTLACPRCGAPLPPDSLQHIATCMFCGVASAPAPASPQVKVVYAMAPGKPVPVTAPPRTLDASRLACPRCSQPLYPGGTGDVLMFGCGWCGGIWLDNDSAHRAVQAFDQATVALANRASFRAAESKNVGPAVACPVCNLRMARVQASQSLVYIDVCNQHGTWFDRYELGVVLEALRPTSHKPSTYDGPTPDFKKGANPELRNAAALVTGGAFALMAGLATMGTVRSE